VEQQTVTCFPSRRTEAWPATTTNTTSRVKLCGVAVPGVISLLGVDVGARGEVLASAMMA
jgi:hypothetical protein